MSHEYNPNNITYYDITPSGIEPNLDYSSSEPITGITIGEKLTICEASISLGGECICTWKELKEIVELFRETANQTNKYKNRFEEILKEG